jgi:heavy metal sensor kinase
MRLTLWHGAVMLIMLGVYIAVIYAVVNSTVSQALDERVRSDFILAASLVDQDEDGTFTWNAPEVPTGTEELPWVQVWTADGSRLLLQNAEAQRRPVAASQQLATRAMDDRVVQAAADPVPMRVLSSYGTIRGVPVVIQVARSEADMRQNLRDLLFVLAAGLPVAVAVAGFGAYWLARRALSPVERMTERARLITAERLGERLPVHNADDEMGRLASVFNETLGRLESSFEQMRRFTADVSHELRTPLTAIRSVGEVGLRGHRDDAGYRTIVGSMLEEADRLATLVDRLLALSRAETGEAKLSKDVVELQRLVEDSAGQLSVLAEEKGQTLSIVRDAAPAAMADAQVLRQAIINLVDNAIKFTPSGGRVELRISENAREAFIDVTDSGPGIPAEASAHIFDRFYRVSSDTDTAAGTGLGLSIAKNAAEANGGRLTLERTGVDGTTFRIAVPRLNRVEARRAG